MCEINDSKITNTIEGLKIFQKSTVERVIDRFDKGQKKVLVADEVGLGKTIVAKGVIAKLLEKNTAGLRVVYICSNQSIANQNVAKLNIFGDEMEDVNRYRLSMQHLVNQRKVDQCGKLKLIAMSPATSFQLKNNGTQLERALMHAVLIRDEEIKKVCEEKDFCKKFENFFKGTADKGWESWSRNEMESLVNEEEKKDSRYPQCIINSLKESDKNVIGDLIEHIKNIDSNANKDSKEEERKKIMHRLREGFAQASLAGLKPDLVIMDEFQRFSELISANDTAEALLMEKLITDDVKVLFLSATPYNMFSGDDNSAELVNLINYLRDDDKFESAWGNYKKVMEDFADGTSAKEELCALKKKVEELMYEVMCRTERSALMGNVDYLDSSKVEEFDINENDVKSYIQIGKLLERIGYKDNPNIEYTKSSPYPMSFMKAGEYVERKKFDSYLEEKDEDNNDKKDSLRKEFPLLWIDYEEVNDYQERVVNTNSKLIKLNEYIFDEESNPELLLWIPPSKTYYPLSGAFENAKNYSKHLVFSKWGFVPRMIGTLVSFEAERRTVGRLRDAYSYYDKKKYGYLQKSENSFVKPRLRFVIGKDKNVYKYLMPIFNLIFPSEYLSKLYNPIEYLKEEKTLDQIREKIKEEIQGQITKILSDVVRDDNSDNQEVDPRWYYLAPFLLDCKCRDESGISYKDVVDTLCINEELKYKTYVKKLREELFEIDKIKLGKQPDDLTEVLANMSIAAPGVCLYRALLGGGQQQDSSGGIGEEKKKITELAYELVNIRFNTREATAIIEFTVYGDKKVESKDEASERKRNHWKNTLKYCADGNMQAMLDEYVATLIDSVGETSISDVVLNGSKKKYEIICDYMHEAFTLDNGNYEIETLKKNNESSLLEKISMRQGIAAMYSSENDKVEKKDNQKHKYLKQPSDRKMNAFNSPFRPFVLASTSVGQEGLDFHRYCRKIVHWNMPTNPINFEQREGRVNRYRCLAVRQGIAMKYGDISGSADSRTVWMQMYRNAEKIVKSKNGEMNDMIPFWCLDEKDPLIPKIERIIPLYPFSTDVLKKERLMEYVSLYRISIGQARQEELIERIKGRLGKNEFSEFFINLCPYLREGDSMNK